MKFMDENPQIERFKFCANDWYTDDGLQKAYKILPEEYKERVKVFPYTGGANFAADYVMQNEMPEKIMKNEKIYQRGYWVYGGNDYVPAERSRKASALTSQTSPFNKPVDFMAIYSLKERKE